MNLPTKLVFVFLHIVIIMGISPAQSPDWSVKLQQQIRASVQNRLEVEKSVTDLTTKKEEVHKIVLEDTTALKKELSYAWEVLATQAKIQDYFQKETTANKITYQLKPEATGKSKLIYQSIQFEPITNLIRCWESRYVSQSSLSQSEIDIEVHFDTKGQYAYHFLKVYSGIPLLGKSVHHWMYVRKR